MSQNNQLPNMPMQLSKSSQEGLIEFLAQAWQLSNTTYDFRSRLEEIDKAYIRESDNTEEQRKAKLANRSGDTTRFQNVTVPVVKPLVEAAVNYQTSVFCAGEPIFSAVSEPAWVEQALQFNTILEEQSERGGWKSELIKFFRDCFKYQLGIIEVDWKREVTYSLTTDLTFSAKEGKPVETVWEGNCIKRLNPYCTFFDHRVDPSQIHSQGEFVGYTELMSRIALKQFFASLPNKIIANIVPAFESSFPDSLQSISSKVYIPQLNPNSFSFASPGSVGSFDWGAWAGISGGNRDGIKYNNMYEVTKLYARILPSDFGIKVPAASTPQVWKFYIINSKVIVYAERYTNAHGWIPVFFGQPYEDGFGLQTKSLAEDVVPMQQVSSAFMNSILASRRRAVSDRVLYDPSRVGAEQINSPNPAAKIPVKPNAYGKPLSEAVYPFPYREDQATVSFQSIQQLQQFSYDITGQNKAKQGQFVKGNKTLHEYSDVMAYANSGDQRISIHLEDQVFSNVKHVLRLNILQFQGPEVLFSRSSKQAVEIDPVSLRQAVLKFDVVDGLTPADKEMSGEAWSTSLQIIGSSAEINSKYNLAPMFSYLMKIRGADLSPFEKSAEQVAYEAAVQNWRVVAEQAVSAGQQPPPQPTPEQFKYDPATQGSSAATPPPTVKQNINNITNNITNNEG